MKKIVLVLSIGLLALAGCGDKNFKTGEGGMQYVINHDEGGDSIKVDDFIGVTYTEKTEEGTIIYNTNDYDGRVMLMFEQTPAFKGDFFTGLRMLSEGDSATFKINLDSVVAREHIPRPATKGKYLIYNVKVNKVIARKNKSDDQYAAAIEACRVAQLEEAKSLEESKFKSYVVSLKTKPIVTASGLNYIVLKQGTGRKPVLGDTIHLYYTIRYLSGKFFETSSPEVAKKENVYNHSFAYPPLKWLLKKETEPSGFKESLLLFPKGSKVRLIIPSRLAYGNNGYKTIRAYTGILCDIEILDIIPTLPGAVPPPHVNPTSDQ